MVGGRRPGSRGPSHRRPGAGGCLCAALPQLLSEEFDAENLQSLGNVALVWSHMAAARALARRSISQPAPLQAMSWALTKGSADQRR